MFMTPEQTKARTHNRTLKFPLYLHEWLKEKAARESNSYSQVVFDCVREAMKRDQREQRSKK